MTSFKFSANDGDRIKEGLQIINNECGTNYDLASLRNMEAYVSNVSTVQNGGYVENLHLPSVHGTFFGSQGHRTAGDYGAEYAYILAFGLPCKDFIGRYKCIYHYNKNAFGMSMYSVLGKIARVSGLNPDPYPDYVDYPEDKVNHQVCHDPRDKEKKDTKIVKGTPPPGDYIDPVSDKMLLYYAAIAAMLFVIYSSDFFYKGTNMLGGFTLDEKGFPTAVGILVHGAIIFAIFFILMKYVVNS